MSSTFLLSARMLAGRSNGNSAGNVLSLFALSAAGAASSASSTPALSFELIKSGLSDLRRKLLEL